MTLILLMILVLGTSSMGFWAGKSHEEMKTMKRIRIARTAHMNDITELAVTVSLKDVHEMLEKAGEMLTAIPTDVMVDQDS